MQPSGCTEVGDKRGNVKVIFSGCLQKMDMQLMITNFFYCDIRKCTIKCAIEYHLPSCKLKS